LRGELLVGQRRTDLHDHPRFGLGHRRPGRQPDGAGRGRGPDKPGREAIVAALVRQGGQRTETARQAVAVVHVGVVARRQG
jgi:hypothetical protein